MGSIELLDKLKNKPVFGLQDIERIAYCNKNYAKQIINRLKKRRLVKQIRRNAYTVNDNIFVVASNLVFPSYVSFWSASHFLGFTEQILSTIQIATTRKAKEVDFEGYKIRFVPLKQFFGYKKIQTGNGEIFVVENEKLLIDVFLKPKEAGNFDEIEKIFKNAVISEEKIVNFLKQVNNQTVVKRVGFLLEKTKRMDVSKNFLLDRNYVLLNPFSKKGGKVSSKWRVKL